jgi:hypothetical protein
VRISQIKFQLPFSLGPSLEQEREFSKLIRSYLVAKSKLIHAATSEEAQGFNRSALFYRSKMARHMDAMPPLRLLWETFLQEKGASTFFSPKL